jgi:hypothetical protein
LCIAAHGRGALARFARNPIVRAWRSGCVPQRQEEGTVKKAFGICGLLGVMVLPADGGQGLSVRVSPAKSFAPSSLRVIARIEPSITNRSLTLIADGENFYRSSAIPLEGDQAPKIVDMQFPNLPSGEYRIVAVVTDAAGHERAVAHDAATVLSLDGQ